MKIEEYAREIASVESQLAAVRAGMKAFEAEYASVLGPCFAELQEIQAAVSAPPTPSRLPKGLKTLFREVARTVHPDLAGDDDGDRRRREEAMAHANAAYKVGNEERLRELLLGWRTDPEAAPGDEIARAKHRLAELRRELRELRQSDLYFLSQRAGRGKLLAEMRKNLEKKLEATAPSRSRLRKNVTEPRP